MADIEEKEQENENQPASPQPPEPVKSSTTRLQETIDRAADQKAARSKITESVVDKRKQAAAQREAILKEIEKQALEGQAALETEPAAEAVQSESEDEVDPVGIQPEPPDLAEMSFDETLNFGLKYSMGLLETVKKDSKARELREIEMHNSQMDTMIHIVNAMNNVMEALKTMCNRLSDINDTLTDIKYN